MIDYASQRKDCALQKSSKCHWCLQSQVSSVPSTGLRSIPSQETQELPPYKPSLRTKAIVTPTNVLPSPRQHAYQRQIGGSPADWQARFLVRILSAKNRPRCPEPVRSYGSHARSWSGFRRCHMGCRWISLPTHL